MASWSGFAARVGIDEQQLRLASIAVVAIVATVALAGCAGIGGGSGQSFSEAQVGVAEDRGPVVAFNYSVNNYATVLLEGPDDNVLNEARSRRMASRARSTWATRNQASTSSCCGKATAQSTRRR